MTENILDPVMKQLDTIEAKMQDFAKKSEEEVKAVGKVSTDTLAALETLGEKQRELADEIVLLKQKGTAEKYGDKLEKTFGEQFTESKAFEAFNSGQTAKVRMEVKNTVTNTVGNTFSGRVPGVVGGAFREFTLEALLNTLPVPGGSNAIDYVRENVYTNNAAETAEAAAKPESSITFETKTMPVSTIAHFLRISKQLAADNSAMAAYINTRMVYGVNLRKENQLIAGNGTGANISGFTASGNFTAHGYTAANLTSAGLLNNRFDLLGKVIGDLSVSDYPADVIIVNPATWWNMRLTKDSQNRYLLGDPGSLVAPNIWGVKVVSSNAIAAGKVMVANLSQAATLWNREGMALEMSDSDADNFTKNLITVRAELRAALTVERPAAVRYGDIVPA